MSVAKQTTITIETDSLLVLQAGASQKFWCGRCSSQVQMIPVHGLGVVSNLLPSEVQDWIDSEDLHRAVSPDGAPLICLNSMLKQVQRSSPG